MFNKKELAMHEFRIDGVVATQNETEDSFLDKFIEWVEANGWSFGGTVYDAEKDIKT